jgi:hypothetical protein
MTITPEPILRLMVRYLGQLDASFGALSDAARRGILERLGSLGSHRLEDEAIWIIKYRRMLEQRIDQVGEFLERTSRSRNDHF